MKALRNVLAAALLASSAGAQAALVTFNFNMTVADAVAPASDPNIWDIVPVGTPINVTYSYDSGAALLSTTTAAGGGTQKNFAGDSLVLTIAVPSAGFTQTFDFATLGSGRIILRDNYPDPSFGDLIDGLSLSLTDITDPNVVTSFGLILRGPTLDLVNGALPMLQDPRWAAQRTVGFQICRDTPRSSDPNDCDLGLLQARAVSAPPTLALAALGLLGLAAARRPRRVEV